MKLFQSFWLFIFVLVVAWIQPVNAAGNATLTITPSTVSNTYSGTITLLITNVPTGHTVVVQKFLDRNTNGVIDGADWLVQQFNLTDGTNFVINGVTNLNVPGDLNPNTTNLTVAVNFQNGDFLQNIVGKYLYKLSSPVGDFSPVTNLFTITNFPFGQKFTGNVVSNTTGGQPITNALVLLFPSPRAGKSGPSGSPVVGVVANNSGTYTLQAPAGTYMPAAFASNYLANFAAPPVLALGSGATVTTNLILTNAASTISGRMVDAASSNLGLPGVMVTAQSSASLFTVTTTDTNGNFTLRVQSGSWKVKADDMGLIAHGYMGLQNSTNVTAGTLTVTNAVRKATALVYGTVQDNLGNPLAGLDVYISDNNNFYETDGYSDTNGNYFLGVVGGTNSWWLQVSTDNGPTNYVFSQSQLPNNGIIASNAVVVQNFIGILATNHVTGNVKFFGTNVPGVAVYAYATINSVNYNQQVDTDASGNYWLNLCNGSWSVGINTNGGNDSLDNIIGAGSYAPVYNQSAIINNNNSTNNFVVQACGGISFVTASTLPVGEVNVYYDQFIYADSCSSSLTWSKIGGSLPGGLSQAQNGQAFELSGTPGSSGTFIFTNQVNDGSHLTNRSFTVSISNALQITTVSLPNGTNGSAYSQQVQAAGGQPPYNTWTIASDSLPPNLNLTTNGLISGTAAVSGNFSFTVGLADSLGGYASQQLSLSLNATNNGTPPTMGVTAVGGQVFICYPTSGSNFVLQTAASVDGPWVNASNGVPAISVLFSNTSSAAFFRLH